MSADAAGDDAVSSVVQAVAGQVQLQRSLADNAGAAGGKEAWAVEQWWQSFNFLFVDRTDEQQSTQQNSSDRKATGPGVRRSLLQRDDMLFFVHDANHPLGPRIGLRRRSPEGLQPELQIGGRLFPRVAWSDTVLLNLVLQATYSLTVTVCRHESLPLVSQGHTTAPRLRSVRKRVYASAMRSSVNLGKLASSSREGSADEGSSRGRSSSSSSAGGGMLAFFAGGGGASGKEAMSHAVQCYPDICFAVLDFEDAFEDTVLSHPDDCYCVVLELSTHADGAAGPAAAPPPPVGGGAIGTLALSQRRTTLFSAYAQHANITSHLNAKQTSSVGAAAQSMLSKLFTVAGGVALPGKAASRAPQEVTMVGPAGVGKCSVAVSPDQQPGRDAGQGGCLKCALMMLSLPKDALIQHVLHAWSEV